MKCARRRAVSALQDGAALQVVASVVRHDLLHLHTRGACAVMRASRGRPPGRGPGGRWWAGAVPSGVACEPAEPPRLPSTHRHVAAALIIVDELAVRHGPRVALSQGPVNEFDDFVAVGAAAGLATGEATAAGQGRGAGRRLWCARTAACGPTGTPAHLCSRYSECVMMDVGMPMPRLRLKSASSRWKMDSPSMGCGSVRLPCSGGSRYVGTSHRGRSPQSQVRGRRHRSVMPSLAGPARCVNSASGMEES